MFVVIVVGIQLLFFLSLLSICESDYAIYNFPSVFTNETSSSSSTHTKNIALTFDDGPHGILTPKLLDVLNETNSKATFFIMGVKAHLHPTILRRIVTGIYDYYCYKLYCIS